MIAETRIWSTRHSTYLFVQTKQTRKFDTMKVYKTEVKPIGA